MLDSVSDSVESVLPVHDGCDLPRLRILGNVWVGVRAHDQDSDDLGAVISYLVPACRPTRKRHDVSFLEFVVAIVHSDGWWSPKHDQQFLDAVMKVVDELRRLGLELPDGTAQRTGGRSN